MLGSIGKAYQHKKRSMNLPNHTHGNCNPPSDNEFHVLYTHMVVAREDGSLSNTFALIRIE